MGRLIKNKGARLIAKAFQNISSCLLFLREISDKRKRMAWKTAQNERTHKCAQARNRFHADTRLNRAPDEPKPRIRNQRRSGIRHKGCLLSCFEFGDQSRSFIFRCVIMEYAKRFFNLKV